MEFFGIRHNRDRMEFSKIQAQWQHDGILQNSGTIATVFLFKWRERMTGVQVVTTTNCYPCEARGPSPYGASPHFSPRPHAHSACACLAFKLCPRNPFHRHMLRGTQVPSQIIPLKILDIARLQPQFDFSKVIRMHNNFSDSCSSFYSARNLSLYCGIGEN